MSPLLRAAASRGRRLLSSAVDIGGGPSAGPSVLGRVNEAMRRQPLLTSIVVTGAKAAAADLMIQAVVEKRARVDERRVATFGLFGATYQGCVQYFLFNHVLEWWRPGRSVRAVALKIAATNFCLDPVLFFPVFYSLREMLATGELGAHTVTAALAKYRENVFEDLRNSWGVWFPCHAVTYGLMPLHLRMPWVALVSFSYVGLLSFTRGDFDAIVLAEEATPAAAAPAEFAELAEPDSPMAAAERPTPALALGAHTQGLRRLRSTGMYIPSENVPPEPIESTTAAAPPPP